LGQNFITESYAFLKDLNREAWFMFGSIRSVYWFVSFIVSIGFSSLKLLKAKILEKQGKFEELDEYAFKVTTEWAKKRMRDSGADIIVHNQEKIPEGPVLFMSNHQGNFDIAIFMASIEKNTGFVAKIEMTKAIIVRGWMKYIHCVFMDRSDIKQSLKIILEGIEVLKKGHSLVVFPEGTRSQCDEMRKFKHGSFKLATKSGVPIVPVTLDGSYKIMEAHGGTITPARVEVYVHDPIPTKGLTKEEINNLPDRVMKVIASKLPAQNKYSQSN